MLRGPDGTPLRPDVVWFNFGFHSLNENAARPEYGLRNYESAYEADLDRVAGVLTNWSRDLRHEHSPPTLLFGLTTPMLFSAHADEVIRRHNVRLARAAQTWPSRPLHLPSACLTRAPRRILAGPSPRDHAQVWRRHGGHARAHHRAGRHPCRPAHLTCSPGPARHAHTRDTRATHARVQCPAHTAHCTRACSLSLRDAPWQCGEPLERQGCFGDPECWGPHCAPAGYAWLARTVIAPAIRGALERRTGGGAPNAPSRTQSRTRRGERVVSESVVAATQLLPSSAAGAQPDSDPARSESLS